MPEVKQGSEQPERLSERIEHYRREIQYLVQQGGEQPQYEFKRAVSLSRENLDDRLDFVKAARYPTGGKHSSQHSPKKQAGRGGEFQLGSLDDSGVAR